jgi:putative endonuclease
VAATVGYYVYILASRRNGTLYTGVTRDLNDRIFDHRNGNGGKFTRRYSVKRLVWYEEYESAGEAIQREKNIKRYYRRWKIELIEKMNPDWFDLYRFLGD